MTVSGKNLYTDINIGKENPRAQSKSYLWVVRTGEDYLSPIILYNYTPTRAGENAIRPVTVSRKNWLFSDTTDGAAANALFLTIVEMAKTYELNLYEYLKFLFEHRPNKDMTEEELSKLAQWDENVQLLCKTKME